MFRIVLTTDSNVRATRWQHRSCVLALLRAIAGHVADAERNFESTVIAVSVAGVAKAKQALPARALRVTNICGRIQTTTRRSSTTPASRRW